MIAAKLAGGATALALLALTFLSGCGGVGYEPTSRLATDEATAMKAAMATQEAGSAYLSGTTALSMSPGYGTQVEYLAPDGRSFLWFPGQIRTTPGHWRVDRDGTGQPRMCFLYGADSYDPVQQTYGGNWECAALGQYFGHLMQLAKGDPFGLHDGMAPFPMLRPPYGLDMKGAQAEGGGKVSQRPLIFVFDRIKR